MIVQVVAELKFEIGRTYRFQREEGRAVDVDLWRLEVCDVSKDSVEVREVGEGIDEEVLRRRRGKRGTLTLGRTKGGGRRRGGSKRRG